MHLEYIVLFVYLAINIHATPRRANNNFFHVDTNKRIVGGSAAEDGEVPYMSAMVLGLVIRAFVCGGSLVTNRHVLTAAHCIDAVAGYGGLYSSLRVVVGTNKWQYGGQSYIVAGNITHENWDSDVVKNDLGLLIVNIDISFTDRIQPVTLNFDIVGGDVITRVAGWGRVMAGGTLSPHLLELILQTVDSDECSKALQYHQDNQDFEGQKIVYDSDVEICAFQSETQGVCNGDSGSGLVRMDSQEQIAIVSWGYRCASGVPDVFVRLSSYKEWIEMALLS